MCKLTQPLRVHNDNNTHRIYEKVVLTQTANTLLKLFKSPSTQKLVFAFVISLGCLTLQNDVCAEFEIRELVTFHLKGEHFSILTI